MKTIFLVLGFFMSTGLIGQTDWKEFNNQLGVLYERYARDNYVDYKSLIASKEIESISRLREEITEVPELELVPYLANVYNLMVIQKVIEAYPIHSILKISNSFKNKDFRLLGRLYSLDELEKEIIKRSSDGRFHFALNCGAKSCPPVPFLVYTSAELDQQIESQSKIALMDENFIKIYEDKVVVSEIFKWYRDDILSKGMNVREYIDAYRDVQIEPSKKIEYYPYDWSLNDISIRLTEVTNSARYVVSNTISEGSVELKIFNNLYSETDQNFRTNYWTTQIGFLYGFMSNFNLGIDLRYRGVQINPEPASIFNIFKGGDASFSRQELSTIGPKIRWTPLPNKIPQISIQSALWIPTGNTLENGEGRAFLDWDGASWLTQVFYDRNIGTRFSFFGEIDFFLEDIGEGDFNRFSTPVTAILSYFPKPQITTYALVNAAPIYVTPLSGYFQFGAGSKYQFSSSFELEFLITKFYNGGDKSAATYNLGIRING